MSPSDGAQQIQSRPRGSAYLQWAEEESKWAVASVQRGENQLIAVPKECSKLSQINDFQVSNLLFSHAANGP